MDSNKVQEMAIKLDNLYDEFYFSLKEDLEEVDENVRQYHLLVDDDPDGKALFGTLYNDSLKIKGQNRERQLKFLNSYKERVAKLESDVLKFENGEDDDEEVNHSGVSQVLKELVKAGEIKKTIHLVPKGNYDDVHNGEMEIERNDLNEDEEDDD